jgi:hypothetical protein
VNELSSLAIKEGNKRAKKLLKTAKKKVEKASVQSTFEYASRHWGGDTE